MTDSVAMQAGGGFPGGADFGDDALVRVDNLADAMAKSAARAMGSSLGRQIIRGVLGSLLGGKKR